MINDDRIHWRTCSTRMKYASCVSSRARCTRTLSHCLSHSRSPLSLSLSLSVLSFRGDSSPQSRVTSRFALHYRTHVDYSACYLPRAHALRCICGHVILSRDLHERQSSRRTVNNSGILAGNEEKETGNETPVSKSRF